MSSFKTLLLAGAVALTGFAAGSANAATFTQTLTWSPYFTDYVNDGRGFYLYDTTGGGILNSVTFSASYGFDSSITVTNSAATTSSGSVRTESASSFAGSTSAITAALNSKVNTAGAASIGGNPFSPAAFDLLGSVANYSLEPGMTTTVTSTKATVTTGPFLDTTAADLAAFSFSGSSIAGILLNSLTGTLLGNTGGNTSASQSTLAGATITITYDYTAAPPPPPPPSDVPEPASIALLGAGLLGLGLFRRKA